MDEWAAQFAEELRRGRVDPSALALAGEEDPAGAAESFQKLAMDPDLRGEVASWVAPLLRSARPGFGARSLVDLAQRRRSRGLAPPVAANTPGLALILGGSNFLVRQLLAHPEWIEELEGSPPAPLGAVPTDGGWDDLRRSKYRGLLRIAARDLLGVPFAETLRDLSDLADHCLTAALARAERETEVEAPVLFALGKLGGRELNLSSDVDLLFVYEPPPGDDLEHNHRVAHLVRHLKGELEKPTPDGFAYRVDLDLRPEGKTGALANSVDAALSYYESFGAEWERQALIRLRAVTGPSEPAARFGESITPFVYRQLIDPDVLGRVRDMKARIEDERSRAGRDLENELKEGPGGIRDVEFPVQALQLFYGGRHPALRAGNALDALAALGREGLLPEAVTASLSDAYLWLRRAEHGVQLAEEQQTARFPSEPGAQIQLARRMGYAESDAEQARARLLDDWTAVKAEVRAHFEALVLREED